MTDDRALATLPPALRALRETLEAERAALIANDADAILRLADEKLRRLRELGSQPTLRDADLGDALRALAELNVANGALIAQRRRENVWTLRQLGLYENGNAYDAQGGYGGSVKSRHRSHA